MNSSTRIEALKLLCMTLKDQLLVGVFICFVLSMPFWPGFAQGYLLFLTFLKGLLGIMFYFF